MKKIVFLIAACALILCIGAGGTLAYLSATSDTVLSTFTVGSIRIRLTESDGEALRMIPGCRIARDTTLTVEKGSEPAWLFVQIRETNNETGLGGKYIDWKVDEDLWTPLEGEEGVYYREETGKAEDTPLNIFANDEEFPAGYVTVGMGLTVQQLEAARENSPVVSVKASAIQRVNIDTVQEAWAQLGS